MIIYAGNFRLKKREKMRKRKNQSINIEEEQRKIEKKNRFFGPDDV